MTCRIVYNAQGSAPGQGKQAFQQFERASSIKSSLFTLLVSFHKVTIHESPWNQNWQFLFFYAILQYLL